MTAPDDDGLHHPTEYFREMYGADDDPWGFDRRWYERRKFALTLAALRRPRYRQVFEPGCANGALTELLAPRCDRLIATELLPEVADRARRRLADQPHVTIGTEPFPAWWPDEPVDLLVLSEVAYYLRGPGRTRAEAVLRSGLATDGEVLAVHFTGDTDYPMSGPNVAVWLDGIDILTRVVSHVDEDFELVVWRRN